MAIDFSKPATKTGLDFSKEVARIPKKVEPPKPAAPAQVTMPTPIDNAKSLFSGGGFQAFGKTVYPTPAPQPTALPKSQYNPFSSFDNPNLPKINTNIGGSTPMSIKEGEGTNINDVIGAPFGFLGGAIGGAIGAVGGSIVAQNKGMKTNTKEYWDSVANDSVSLAKEMYKNGSDVGAAGTKLGVATAVAPALVAGFFTAMTGKGIFDTIVKTKQYSDELKASGDKNVGLYSTYKLLQNGGAEGFRMLGLDEQTINSLNDNDFFNAVGNVLLYGGAFTSVKGLKSEAKPFIEKYGKLSDFLTKDKIIEYKLPETVKISPQEVFDIYSGKANYEKNLSTLEKAQFLKELNLTREEINSVRSSGISIEKPTEVVIKLADKPWFAKIKKFLNIEPVERVVGGENLGVAKKAPAGLIEDTSSAPKEFTFAGQEQLNQTPQVIEPVFGLDFKAEPTPSIPANLPINSQPVSMPESIPSNKITLTKDFDIDNMDDPRTIKARYEAELLSGIENSQAGRRIILGSGIEKQVITESSTFPAWIPDKYRKSAIIQPVIEHIKNGTLPTSKPQLEFYNIIKEDFDSFGNEIESAQKEINADEIDFGTAEKMLAEDEKLLKQYDQQEKSSTPKSESVSAKAPSGKVKADKGVYSEEVKGKGETDLKTIETPEQYRLAKAIGPNMNFVMKNSRKYNGYFSPQPGAEEIGMNRALYKRGKDETKEAYQLRIGKTMAHEIGHFIDYLPDEITNRGNLIGRLQTLSNFKRNFIAEDDVLKQRQTLMRKINEINKNDELLDSMQARLTEPLMKELQALNDGITFNNPAFKDELVKLTHKWKPWEEGVDEKYDAYRKNAAELYADFNSVLFNDPALAQEIAPRFYNEFFNFLSKKPEVEKAFLGIQSELMGDRASLMEKRYQMLKDSGKNAQQKFVSMIAERDALKKKPWMEAAKKEMWYQHAAVAKKGVKAKNQIEIIDRGFHNEVTIIGETKIRPIIEDLKAAGLDSNDMDAVLVLERIAKDTTRENVANIKGLDVKTAQDVLDELTPILGEKKANALVKAAKDFRAVLQEQQLKYPDLFTPEILELIKSNDFYAAFNVLFKESNNVNYYIKQSKGNIDKDFSAFTNTMLRLRTVIHAGNKNIVKKNLIDIFIEGGSDIKKAEVSYQKMENGQLVRTVKKAPQGWDQVDIKRNGKVESYYMPEDIAHSLNQDRIQDIGTVFKFLKAMNKPFRQLYTGPIAIGFQVANFIFRDAGTAAYFFGPEWVRSQKGLSNSGLNILANNTYRLLFSKLTQAKYYYKAFKDLREKNIAKRYTPMVLEAMKNHVIEVDSSATFTMDTKDLSQQEEAGMKYVLNLMGLTEKGTKWQEFGAKTRGFTQSLEETPKLAAYMYFNDLGIVNEQNLVNIRNHVGSPNFWSKGTLNGQLSGPLMFYNPIIQGQVNMFQKAFVKDAAGKGSRNAFWWRMFRKAILPVMVTVAAEEGMFGEDIKKMMDRVPEYMLTSYDVIPMYIIPETGKLRYISLPRDEEARFIGALTRKILKTAVNSEDKAVRKNAISDLLTFTGGQLPSSAPGLSIVNTWSMAMLANANPYDSFRGQNIFLTNEENLPKSEKAKILAKWTLNQSGFLKLNIHDSVESRTIDEQTIAMTPGVNRFVRTDNRGIYEDDQKIVDAEREKAALELMKKKGVVNGVVEAVHKDPKYNANAELLKLAKERLGAEASDSKALLKEFKTLNSAMQEEYVTNFGNVHYRSLINQSNDTKEKLLLSIYDRGEMTKKEYVNFLITSKSLNLISNEIIGKVLVGTGLASLKK